MVAHRARIFPSDEELGKRDDDHIPGKMAATWSVRARPTGTWLRKRRIFGVLAAGLLVWLFIHNIPTDLGPQDFRPRYGQTIPKPKMPNPITNSAIDGLSGGAIPRKPPPKATTPTDKNALPPVSVGEAQHSYDGPVKFYHLAKTLRSLPYDMGYGPEGSPNVLFAASDLNCAASIIPLACEMARWDMNRVHMVVMGRDSLGLNDIKKINGIDEKVCNIYWHDGRPDYASMSTDRRMSISVAGGLGHIATAMKPQAIVVADSNSEDTFFSDSIQWKSRGLNIPLIEIPKNNPESLSWMSRLSARALRAWHKASIDIVVQVSQDESGSLVRLLQSLQAADYSGFVPPRLTIELPPKLDDATNGFLHYFFQWPPGATKGPASPSLLTLRRRIPDKRLDPDTAAARFIESFYPTNADGPHVLVLSPQAELSPVYFHYLKMHMLEYRYSQNTHLSQKILGISLEDPSYHLNGSDGFQPPQDLKESESTSPASSNQLSPFLWQAPNSNAALYFGDKWTELHSFLTKRETAVLHPRTRSSHRDRPKKISSKNPAWTEFVLDLMHARGYSLHYPGFPKSSSSGSNADDLVVIHNDLYTPPEEFTPLKPSAEEFAVEKDSPQPEFLSVNSDYLQSHQPGVKSNQQRTLLSKLLPVLPVAPVGKRKTAVNANEHTEMDNEDEPEDWYSPSSAGRSTSSLPQLSSLPILDSLSALSSQQQLDDAAVEFAASYRHYAGGCTTSQARKKWIEDFSAEDLFCLDEDEITPPLVAPLEDADPPKDNPRTSATSTHTRLSKTEADTPATNEPKNNSPMDDAPRAGDQKP